MHKIVVGIGGSSGSIYAKVLLDRLKNLKDQTQAVGVVMTENAKFNWKYDGVIHEYLNSDNARDNGKLKGFYNFMYQIKKEL